MRPVVALLTDFGTRDHYVGAMKGVVLSICRDAAVVDITHEIPPQDVVAAALELQAAHKYFPPQTVFLVVVDPGVGSGRRAIAASAGAHRFVAPDNGVLTAAFAQTRPELVVALQAPELALPVVSRTFEGRDRFAPAAAHLANGVPLAAFGPAVTDYESLALPAPRVADDVIEGEVVRIDRFGNLITNIDRSLVEAMARGHPLTITVALHEMPRLVGTYADAARGELIALFGSTDHLEIAVSGGSAAQALGVGCDTRVVARAGRFAGAPGPRP